MPHSKQQFSMTKAWHTKVLEALSLYDLGRCEDLSLVPNARNNTYRFRANGELLIAKTFACEAGLTDDLHYKLELLNFLRAKGLPVSGPLSLRDGRLSVEITTAYGRRVLVVLSYAHGHTLCVNTNEFYKFGMALARMHQGMDQFTGKVTNRRLGMEELVHVPLRRVLSFLSKPDDCRFLARVAEYLHSCFGLLPLSPPGFGLCHGDAHHFNVHADKRGRLTFFDFDEFAVSWRAYDIATAIWGTFGRGENIYVWKALVEGYSKVRQISEEESAVIPAFIAARHLWWLGFHAQNWGSWKCQWLNDRFFSSGLELLRYICLDACGVV